jgi:hypothetical protein
MVAGGAGCGVGWTSPTLGKWAGSVAGCNKGGKVSAHHCHHKDLTAKTATTVAAVKAASMSLWRGGHFCLRHLVVDKTHADTRVWLTKDGAACPTPAK